MADQGFKRKLAAILSADVEGFCRLMEDDAEATVRTFPFIATPLLASSSDAVGVL